MAGKKESNIIEEMRTLRAQLQAGNYAPVYLVMGPQAYLRVQNRDLIRDALLAGGDAMNSAYYTGDNFTIQEIIDLAETMPFLAERRVITIEDSWLFGKNAANTDALTDYLPRMPETTHLVLVAAEVDRTRRLYKAIQKAGTVLNCTTPEQGDLERWVQGRLREAGATLTPDAYRLFMEDVGDDLLNIKSEIDKLTAYGMGRECITREDVETICSPGVQDRIFDLISAISGHQADRALAIYMDERKRQTPPQVILALMIRNYNQMLQVLELAARGMSADEIATTLHANAWAIRKRILPEARSHSSEELRRALQDCIQTDQDYKAGRISDQLGIETLIVRHATGIR